MAQLPEAKRAKLEAAWAQRNAEWERMRLERVEDPGLDGDA
jgi:hypothetical protein